MINLGSFKITDDVYDHLADNRVLRTTGQLLQLPISENVSMARTAGMNLLSFLPNAAAITCYSTHIWMSPTDSLVPAPISTVFTPGSAPQHHVVAISPSSQLQWHRRTGEAILPAAQATEIIYRREIIIMSGRIDARLAELSVVLPEPPAPVAAYVPYVQTGNLVFISGQVSFLGGDDSLAGKVDADLTPEQGQQAARNSALNMLAHLKNACHGDLDRVKRCVSLRIYVASTPDFTGQPGVGNGASELVAEIFGDAGKHSRAAVGVTALPLNCAVEVESVWEID